MPTERQQWVVLKLGGRGTDIETSIEGSNQGDHCLIVLTKTSPVDEYFFREHNSPATYTKKEARHVCKKVLQNVCEDEEELIDEIVSKLFFDEIISHDALCVRVYTIIRSQAQDKLLPLAACLSPISTTRMDGRLVDQTWEHSH